MSQGFDFILPKVKNWFEPLHAVYSRNCIKSIEHILNKGNKVIVELFNYVRVRYIEAEEIDPFFDRLGSLKNKPQKRSIFDDAKSNTLLEKDFLHHPGEIG